MLKRSRILHHETIFAVSSAVGRSAVAIVRLSGPGCDEALRVVAPGPALGDRLATLRRLKDHRGDMLDKGLVVRFYAPRSFTGEDMAELHVTGGRAVLAGVIETLGSISGLRPAEPGEFAWRAFENEKLDLSEVEGLAELVSSETAAQRRQALRIADGHLSKAAEAIRSVILKGMSLIEAEIDFSDSEDVSMNSTPAVREAVQTALALVEKALHGADVAERLRTGMTVVIAGPPNVGKSTLINALSKRDVAIVSEIPGTTRDVLEVNLELDGFPVKILDTAGIRDTADRVEQLGVDLAKKAAAQSDVMLWLFDDETPAPALPQASGQRLFVRTKCDLHGPVSKSECGEVVAISAKSGLGLPELLDRLRDLARTYFAEADTNIVVTQRQKAAFHGAEQALRRILDDEASEPEMLAEDLRLAASAMGRISGRIDVEDVLGDIFSRLCIGK